MTGYRQVLARFENAVRESAFQGAAHPEDRLPIDLEYRDAKAALIRILQQRPAAKVERCTAAKSIDGGSCSERIPCDREMRGDEMSGGCGEPCSFIMDHPIMPEIADRGCSFHRPADEIEGDMS